MYHYNTNQPIAKSTRLEIQVERFCLVAAPLLFGASTFFWNNGEYGTEAATLIVLSMFCWIPALKGLFGLVSHELPRYSVIGCWLAVFGCISGVCFAFLGYLTTIFGISHVQYLQSLSNYPATSQILPFASGPIFPLSLLVLGIILLVKRKLRFLNGLLFCAGALMFPVSRIPRIEWIAHIADLLILAPCVWIAVRAHGMAATQT